MTRQKKISNAMNYDPIQLLSLLWDCDDYLLFASKASKLQ